MCVYYQRFFGCFELKRGSLCGGMCLPGVDASSVVKIVIGPAICLALLLCVAVVGFMMFKKKYVSATLSLLSAVLFVSFQFS